MEERLLLESDLAQIATARRWFADHARAAHCHRSVIRVVEVALGEALANVIRHAYQSRPGQPIRIALTVDSERICLIICDRGAHYFAGATQKADGFGLVMIRGLMDEVSFRPAVPQGTCLRMVKCRAGCDRGRA